MRSFIPATGRTQHVAGVCLNRIGKPYSMPIHNQRKGFSASFLLGMGFTFDDVTAAKGETEDLDAMRQLIGKAPLNAERIFPYIGGEEINTSPTHAHHRYVIDFFDRPLGRRADLPSWAEMTEREREQCLTRGLVPSDYPEEVAEDWPDLLEIVYRRVKPHRDRQKRDARKNRWWQFAEKSPGLYRTIAPLERILAMSRISSHLAFTQLPSGMVYSIECNVFAFPNLAPFSVLQSRPHEIWARFFASSMKDDLRYTPSDCFETFPFPDGVETSALLETAGQTYHDERAALMVARNEGMTKTYNRFHDPTEVDDDIQRLRELHAAMDCAVLEAYGWRDLAARAVPLFLDETNEDDHTYQGRLFWPSDFRDEILARLLALNAERHAEEVRLGIAPGKKGTGETDEGEGSNAML
jgi:hypothetical protein